MLKRLISQKCQTIPLNPLSEEAPATSKWFVVSFQIEHLAISKRSSNVILFRSSVCVCIALCDTVLDAWEASGSICFPLPLEKQVKICCIAPIAHITDSPSHSVLSSINHSQVWDWQITRALPRELAASSEHLTGLPRNLLDSFSSAHNAETSLWHKKWKMALFILLESFLEAKRMWQKKEKQLPT